eukprot:13048_5
MSRRGIAKATPTRKTPTLIHPYTGLRLRDTMKFRGKTTTQPKEKTRTETHLCTGLLQRGMTWPARISLTPEPTCGRRTTTAPPPPLRLRRRPFSGAAASAVCQYGRTRRTSPAREKGQEKREAFFDQFCDEGPRYTP